MVVVFITCPANILLGTFLLNNYKQALSVLETKPAIMIALANVGAGDGTVVKQWLQEEEVYLRSLKKEPTHETLEMEYYTLLVSLNASK